MMNTAYTYSCKWRFKFNADKSCILTIVAKRNKQPTEKNPIHLGNSLIPFGKAYNHQGIALNIKAKLGGRIATACKKGWKSFYGLSDNNQHYQFVRTSVLYGCELWNAITQARGRSTSEYITTWHMKSYLEPTKNKQYPICANSS